MRKFGLLISILLAAITVSPAYAQVTGAYVGVDMGTAGNKSIGDICSGIGGETNYSVPTCEERILSTRFKFGIHATDTFGVEASYQQSGSYEVEIVDTDTNDATLETKFTSFGIALRGRFHVADRLWAYGKVGAHKWELEPKVHPVRSIHREAFASDGFDVMYGGGVDWYFTEELSLNVGIDELNGGNHADTRYIYAGFAYTY